VAVAIVEVAAVTGANRAGRLLAHYNTDLAYIYEAGFGGFASGSAPGLLRLLRRHRIHNGLIVDLACGNGIWPRYLTDAGYHVVAVDNSAAMVRLARKNAPQSRCVRASLADFPLPRCRAITVIGQGVSHSFNGTDAETTFSRFCRCAYRALQPGGVLIFDYARPGRNPAGMAPHASFAGDDWSVRIDGRESPDGKFVCRDLEIARKLNGQWRYSHETHRLRLFEPDRVAALLVRAGFEARALRGYGSLRFRSGSAGVIAAKS
jgi:SAM-dependent methyltransferase